MKNTGWKGWEWSGSKIWSSKVVAPPVSVKGHVGRVRMNKHLNVLTHKRHMESPNWVASCVDEFDGILPRFTDVQWDSVRITHGMSIEAYTWKTTLGRGRTRPGLLVTSWIVVTRGASGPACVVLSGLYPCKIDYQFQSPWHPRTWVIAYSLHLNVELSTL
jgi:hypothetical protein